MNNMSNEQCLVWCADTEEVDYVRVGMVTCRRRAGRPPFAAAGRLLGWAELHKTFKPWISGQFDRRIFWLSGVDRGEADDDGCYTIGCPIEAVDPRTLERRGAGFVTVRAWGSFAEDAELASFRQNVIEALLT